jgi:hypothetical protein
VGPPPWTKVHEWRGGAPPKFASYCRWCEADADEVRRRFTEWRYEQLIERNTAALRAIGGRLEDIEELVRAIPNRRVADVSAQEGRDPADDYADTLRTLLDCKGSYEGTVSERGGYPAVCSGCADLARAALDRHTKPQGVRQCPHGVNVGPLDDYGVAPDQRVFSTYCDQCHEDQVRPAADRHTTDTTPEAEYHAEGLDERGIYGGAAYDTTPAPTAQVNSQRALHDACTRQPGCPAETHMQGCPAAGAPTEGGDVT